MKKNIKKLQSYEFSLVLPEDVELDEELENSIIGSNCDDCLISSFHGRVELDFERDGATMSEVVLTAISDFKESGAKGHVRFVKWNGKP